MALYNMFIIIIILRLQNSGLKQSRDQDRVLEDYISAFCSVTTQNWKG